MVIKVACAAGASERQVGGLLVDMSSLKKTWRLGLKTEAMDHTGAWQYVLFIA